MISCTQKLGLPVLPPLWGEFKSLWACGKVIAKPLLNVKEK
jgi:hypothetical protein